MDKQQFGDFIAENRKAAGLTQKELAAQLHVTDKAVSKWERALSYPDVTLLEPLAGALGMGVEELMACRRREERKETEATVRNLLEISQESLKRERRKNIKRIAAAAFLMLLAGLAAAWYMGNFVREEREQTIYLKETVGEENFLYVEEGRHLLRLKCGGSVDFEDIKLTDERGSLLRYRLTCRWNRRTMQGSVSACQETGAILADVRDTLGASLLLDEPLFGYREVWQENTYGVYDPELQCDIMDWTFWTEPSEGERKVLLKVKEGVSCMEVDWDEDGEQELAVRTRWKEKPYAVYDLEDGGITVAWPDDLPVEWKERLMTPAEQQARLPK